MSAFATAALSGAAAQPWPTPKLIKSSNSVQRTILQPTCLLENRVPMAWQIYFIYELTANMAISGLRLAL